MSARPDSTRAAFGKVVGLMADAHGAAVIDTDTGTVKRPPRKAPYLNIGIAENTAVGMASGMSLNGTPAIVVGFSAFLAGRAYEFIKLDIALPCRPVVLVGTHGGMSGGWLGPTHYALEDVALMASLPNLAVLVPADASRVPGLLDAALASGRPHYLRLGRKESPCFEPPQGWGAAGWSRLGPPAPSDGKRVIVAVGPAAIQASLDALNLLAHEVSVPDVIALENLDVIPDLARELSLVDYVLVAEEGWDPGYVVSTFREMNPRQRIESIGCTNAVLPPASYASLCERTGLTAESIATRIAATSGTHEPDHR